jgi:HSP20 family protein
MSSITTWNPFRDLGFPRHLASLAESLFRDSSPTGKNWVPAVDVTESDHEYLVKAEVPDVKNEDVKVSVKDGILTIRGERKYEKRTDNEKVHLIERSFGSFSRSFTLPKDANAEKVNAEFKNGVLSVVIPKREEVKPKEIEVKVQ